MIIQIALLNNKTVVYVGKSVGGVMRHMTSNKINSSAMKKKEGDETASQPHMHKVSLAEMLITILCQKDAIAGFQRAHKCIDCTDVRRSIVTHQSQNEDLRRLCPA